jgi:hypothetical protein
MNEQASSTVAMICGGSLIFQFAKGSFVVQYDYQAAAISTGKCVFEPGWMQRWSAGAQ